MDNRLVALAAGVLPEFDPATIVSASASAGFSGSGVWVDVPTWTAAVAGGVRRRLEDTGLVALDAEVARIGPGGDIGQAERVVEAAADVGARNVLCISAEPDRGATAAAFSALCRRAAPAGVRCVLEFMRFTAVKTLDDAAAVVATAGEANGGVLVDALHLSRSGHQPADLARFDPGLFPYAQICDAGPVAPVGDAALRDEALDGRLLPGEGVLPLAGLLAALPAGLPVSLEIRSAALRSGHPDPVARARAVHSSMMMMRF